MFKRNFLIVAIIAFTTVLIWVITNILHAQASVKIDPGLQEALTPLSAVFDSQTLSQVSQISPLPQSEFAPSPTPAPTLPPASPTPIPTASASATPQPTLKPSPSANPTGTPIPIL